jgi:hypothetical protein
MKTYIIYTSTYDKDELCGGIYLVNAYSEEDAKGRWVEQIDKFSQFKPETITSVEEYKGSSFMSCLQEPVIE